MQNSSSNSKRKTSKDKILNPATGRYVQKTGKIGRKILNTVPQPSSSNKPNRSSTASKSSPKKTSNSSRSSSKSNSMASLSPNKDITSKDIKHTLKYGKFSHNKKTSISGMQSFEWVLTTDSGTRVNITIDLIKIIEEKPYISEIKADKYFQNSPGNKEVYIRYYYDEFGENPHVIQKIRTSVSHKVLYDILVAMYERYMKSDSQIELPMQSVIDTIKAIASLSNEPPESIQKWVQKLESMTKQEAFNFDQLPPDLRKKILSSNKLPIARLTELKLVSKGLRNDIESITMTDGILILEKKFRKFVNSLDKQILSEFQKIYGPWFITSIERYEQHGQNATLRLSWYDKGRDKNAYNAWTVSLQFHKSGKVTSNGTEQYHTLIETATEKMWKKYVNTDVYLAVFESIVYDDSIYTGDKFAFTLK